VVLLSKRNKPLGKHTLECDLLVNDTHHPLDFKILMDDEEILKIRTTKPTYRISHKFLSTPSEHSIKFILSGKTDEHTTLDGDTFIKSAQVEVTNITFDGINISEILLSNESLTTYTHNSNGYSEEIVENFNTSCMGFNGVMELKFTTPLFVWLLDIS